MSKNTNHSECTTHCTLGVGPKSGENNGGLHQYPMRKKPLPNKCLISISFVDALDICCIKTNTGPFRDLYYLTCISDLKVDVDVIF